MMFFKTLVGKMSAFLLGAIFVVFVLEAALRITGYVMMSTQESRNRISLAARGAYRIMCIGESTTADLTCDTRSYPRQLGEILNARSLREFSVVNKGIPDGDTPTIMAELEKNLDIYCPDMVVAMMGINDGREKFDPDKALKASRFRLDDGLKALRLISLVSGDLKKKREVDEQLERPAYLGSKGVKLRKMGEKAKRILSEGYAFMSRNEFDKAREIFEKGSKEYQQIVWSYLALGDVCRKVGEYAEAERIYRNVIEGNVYGEGTEASLSPKDRSTRNIQQLNALLYLGWNFMEQAKYDEAEVTFNEAAKVRPDLAFKGLAALYAKKGDVRTAEVYHYKGMQASPEMVNPVTKMNYNRLKKILDSRGIKLVAVQYPTKDVASLEKVFDDPSGVTFVDNGDSFRSILSYGNYDEYFVDRCYSDFGHGTNKGNRLLAENVAQAILEALADEQEGRNDF